VRAAVAPVWGGPEVVEVRELPDPEPGPGEALVQVRAAALNYPDLLLIANRYQVSVPPPFIPGSEFSGEVLSVGPGVTGVGPGDAVIGGGMVGAFAERIAVPARSLRPRPAGLDWHQAAAYWVTSITAYHALVTVGELRPGQTVVALGAAGGVGSAVVDIARRTGARVVAVTSGADRVRLVRELGADVVIDRTTGPLRERLQEALPEGAEVVVDPVGGTLSEAVLRRMAWGGRFVVVGFAAGDIPRIPLNLVLLKGVQIRGLELRTLAEHDPVGARNGERQLGQLVAQGLRPSIGSVYPLAEIGTALKQAAAGGVLGKTVIDLVHPASTPTPDPGYMR
jgi:NADPH2:quinone reductase